MTYELVGKRVWVAGHTGMVGTAIRHHLTKYRCDLQIIPRINCDLRSPKPVDTWISIMEPEVVVIAAATVGGIGANAARPVDFLHDNLLIAANIMHSAWRAKVEKLLFLGSSCIYPKEASQPIEPGALLTGPLEPTNEPYAIAKIAGIKLCQAYRRQYGCDFITCMPTNLYGPGDRFDELDGHVIPALMTRLHRAKVARAPTVDVWGTGRAMREFLHVDDLADACVHLLMAYSGEAPVNVGSGEEISIHSLVNALKDVVGYQGEIRYDHTKPDGTLRKRLDSSVIRELGWRPRVYLANGLRDTYRWYQEHLRLTEATLRS